MWFGYVKKRRAVFPVLWVWNDLNILQGDMDAR